MCDMSTFKYLLLPEEYEVCQRGREPTEGDRVSDSQRLSSASEHSIKMTGAITINNKRTHCGEHSTLSRQKYKQTGGRATMYGEEGGVKTKGSVCVVVVG